MSGPSAILDRLGALLAPHGLMARGVVRFRPGETAPELSNGGTAAAVVLIGVTGEAMWPAFAAWRETQPDGGGPDPLDRWSVEVLDAVASAFGALALYPSEPPYQPFQSWAMRAEGLKPSPLGLLIHPVYGLWHSYRGALAFTVWREGQEGDGACGQLNAHACDRCAERPCLSVCPVQAVSFAAFDVAGCRRHLAGQGAPSGCMTQGCLARDACPVGRGFRYPQAQVHFHMQALQLPDA